MGEFVFKEISTEFQGSPLRVVEATWKVKSNDPEFRDGQFLGQEFPVQLDIAVHPNMSRKIIFNVPGAGGNIDGYAEKYKKLCQHIQKNGLGAVVRTGNHIYAGFLPDVVLRGMLEYSKSRAWEICGEPDPEIMMMGFSAGASAVAAVAHEYPKTSKILLYAPSGDMPEKLVRTGLAKFNGEVYIVIGKEDDVVGVGAGKLFYDMATGASHRELHVIPNCDHQFRGEKNGRIMSEAPFYAFREKSKKPQFPDPKGGIKLYS